MENLTGESVDELRDRLKNMRKLMNDRKSATNIHEGRSSTNHGLIDGSFLSMVFGTALVVIVTVSVYAFYNLYSAIFKRFSHPHEEL